MISQYPVKRSPTQRTAPYGGFQPVKRRSPVSGSGNRAHSPEQLRAIFANLAEEGKLQGYRRQGAAMKGYAAGQAATAAAPAVSSATSSAAKSISGEVRHFWGRKKRPKQSMVQTMTTGAGLVSGLYGGGLVGGALGAGVGFAAGGYIHRKRLQRWKKYSGGNT